MHRCRDPGGDAAAPSVRPPLGRDHGVFDLRALQPALCQQYLAPPDPQRQASGGSRGGDQSRTHRPVRRGSEGNSLHHRILRPLGVGGDLRPAQARPRAAASVSESVRSKGAVQRAESVCLPVIPATAGRARELLTQRAAAFFPFVPTSMLRFPRRRPEIKVLPIKLSIARVPFGIVTLRNRTLSPVAQLFIEDARAVAKPLVMRKL